MTEYTKNALQEAKDWCNENEKSTEFTLEYMQDYAMVDLNCVLNFLDPDND